MQCLAARTMDKVDRATARGGSAAGTACPVLSCLSCFVLFVLFCPLHLFLSLRERDEREKERSKEREKNMLKTI